ncbi:hypothetical protein [Saccharothrix sp.]|nr:hypothetical protein [Saccharothrix sp.]
MTLRSMGLSASVVGHPVPGRGAGADAAVFLGWRLVVARPVLGGP